MNRNWQLLLSSGVLLAAGMAAGATAQTVFKSTDRQGRVGYADTPAPDAVKVEQIQSAPATVEDSAGAAAEGERVRRQAEQVTERERLREAALDGADAEVVAASEALQQAQQRREAGVEPLPGERLGLVGGHSRLSPTYVERLQELERDVSDAQQRLDKAYARRNELR